MVKDIRGLASDSGITLIPASDGKENVEFEKRIVDKLALIDHVQIVKEMESLQNELATLKGQIAYTRRIVARTKYGRVILAAWNVWATICAITGVALPIAAGIVLAVAGNQDVVSAVDTPEVTSPVVKPGGVLTWSMTLTRHESCPGEVVEAFNMIGTSNITTQRRPVMNATPREGAIINFESLVPKQLLPGRYHFSFSVDSRCPVRTRLDKLATFDFEVSPS